MALKLTDTQNYTNIANAIRSKTGKSGNMTPSQMATEISGIETESDFDIFHFSQHMYVLFPVFEATHVEEGE